MAARRAPRPRGRRRRAEFSAPPLPRVVIRFEEGVALPWHVLQGPELQDQGIGPWRDLEVAFPGITISRVFHTLGEKALDDLVLRARRMTPGYVPGRFASYFHVDAPAGTDFALLAERLLGWDTVEMAYVSTPGRDPLMVLPPIVTKNDPKWALQKYLDPAPVGIDAEFAWRFPGGHGELQTFSDLERGWKKGHEDFAPGLLVLAHGDNYPPSREHGTRVVGTVCATDDNSLGGTGIAPDVAAVRVYGTMVDDGASWQEGVADAITVAANELAIRDVLLIESQTGADLPREVENACLIAIQLAVANKIVVVAVAGNGSTDLDALTNASGHNFLDRTSPHFVDSGAILVAGADSPAPHRRSETTNHGNRIDCYAWGDHVTTSDTNTAGTLTNLYTTNFGGTSAAAAIVAGVAVTVQGLLEAQGQTKLDPPQMRTLLSDRRLGTDALPPLGAPSAPTPPWAGDPGWPPAPDPSRINVMPDLRKVIGEGLGMGPFVYLRADVALSELPSELKEVARCPDLIVRRVEVAHPVAEFGMGSGNENTQDLSDEVQQGIPYFIYARPTNRGTVDSGPVHVDLYEGPAAAYLPPHLWNPVGQAAFSNVPGGRVLAVSTAVPWGGTDQPGPRSFVAVLGSESDPAPPQADFAPLGAWMRALHSERRAVVRGFARIPAVHGARVRGVGSVIALPFKVAGTDDGTPDMTLEVESDVAPGTLVGLHGAADWIRTVLGVRPDAAGSAAYPVVRIGAGVWESRPMTLAARAMHDLRLLVQIRKDVLSRFGRITVRQKFAGRPVGGMTWVLVPTL